MLDILEGKWHLLYSNFNMWRDTRIADVTFNYTPLLINKQPALLDEVKYLKGSTEKTITGYDYPFDDATFTWRGKGLLKLLSSKWQVEWMNDKQDCLILSFEKTMITAAGVDIITRTPAPAAAVITQAKQIIYTNERLRQTAEGLFAVPVSTGL